jgi:HAD superfamily hydrolase (TIGR01509 family)
VIPLFPVYLFDVDGTLLDSAADIVGAIQEMLAANGRANAVDFDFLKNSIGHNLAAPFAEIFPDYNSQQIDELIRQYRVIYLARGHRQTRVYPGVPEALAALPGRKSTATTKGTPTTRAVLEQFGLIQYFDHVQGTDGFPYKPAPDLILTAMAALGARPEDCLMVGDSPADMEAGKRAGVKTCAVRYGYGKPEDLALFAPDFWIDDLRALAPNSPAAPGPRGAPLPPLRAR